MFNPNVQVMYPTAARAPRDRGRRLSTPAMRAASKVLGTPLTDVRIHEDGAADALGLEAYALGANVHFARGTFRPASRHGARVLGHELAHVAQQRAGRVPVTRTLLGLPINDQARLEAAADRDGRAVAERLHASSAAEATHATLASPASGSDSGAAAPAEPVVQGFGLMEGALGAAAVYALYRIYKRWTQPAAAPQPVAQQPVAPQPVAPQPVAPQPVAPQPVAPEPAEQRMARWVLRGASRQPIQKGRYDTPTGPVTVSSRAGQLIAQTRREDYGDATHGSIPSYPAVAASVPHRALPSLLSRPASGGLTGKEASATSLASVLAHASEEHAAHGAGKLQRALVRRAISEPSFKPYDPKVNPAVPTGGHRAQQDLLARRASLTEEQRRTIDKYASDSSDDEAPQYPFREPNPLWTKRED